MEVGVGMFVVCGSVVVEDLYVVYRLYVCYVECWLDV